jgi:SulP family sulfate permease
MAPTVVGALFARTVLMTTTLTSAIALSSQSVPSQAGLDPRDPATSPPRR